MLAASILDRARRMRRPLELAPAHSVPGLVAVLRKFGEAVLREATHPAVIAVFRLAVAAAVRSQEIARELVAAGRTANRDALALLLARPEISRLLDGDPASMAREFLSLLWDNLQLQLLLRTARRPSSEEIVRRGRNATDALLALHARSGADTGDR
jgi:hypothetical protein